MATTKTKTTKKSTPKAKKPAAKKSTAAKKSASKSAKSKSTPKKSTTTKKKAPASTKKEVKTNDVNKFAVIEVNSQQLMVHEGGKYEIDRIDGDKGDKLSVAEVLLVADDGKVSIGKPYVKGAKVDLVIDSQKQGKKRRVFKYKAKSRYRRTYGHRDQITRLEVKSIKA